MAGRKCPKCSKINCANKQKNNIEECKNVVQKKGGVCLSDIYENNKTHMKWKCKKGHIWNARYDQIKRGTWCSECKGVKRLTIDECNKLAKEMVDCVYLKNIQIPKLK